MHDTLQVNLGYRCNLTILFEPGQEDLARFLAEQRVEITASLPCYSVGNVDKQRGAGVFEKSIAALQQLNALGSGADGSGLVLNQLLALTNMPIQRFGSTLVSKGTFDTYMDLLKADLDGQSICISDHCFGCTAGQGSSCGGALGN